MYIPGPDAQFRLVSWDKKWIGRMFYPGEHAHPNGNIKLNHCNIANDLNYNDGSWWMLKKLQDDYYGIMNVTKNARLYVKHERNDEAGLVPDTDKGYRSDEKWKIKVDESKGAFQLISYEGNRRLVLRVFGIPHIGLASEGEDYDDQYFQFQQYDGIPEVKCITFDLALATSLGRFPKDVAQQRITNNGNVEQSQTYSIEYTQVKKHRWEQTQGETINTEWGLTVSTGLPLFSSIDQSFEFGSTTESHWTTEEVEEESKEQTFEFPLTAPPHTRVTSKVIIFEDSWSVPYEMELFFPKTGHTKCSSGKWHGVQAVLIDSVITMMDCPNLPES